MKEVCGKFENLQILKWLVVYIESV